MLSDGLRMFYHLWTHLAAHRRPNDVDERSLMGDTGHVRHLGVQARLEVSYRVNCLFELQSHIGHYLDGVM